MDYKFEKAEKSTVKITMTFDANEWKAAENKAYDKVKGKYSVPGFRKGHAPKKMLEASYGAGIFFETAVNDLFVDNYYTVLDKEPTIVAVGNPNVDIGNFDDKGLELIAIVPVKPEVKLADYKGIKFEKSVYNVKADDVDNEILRLRERNSRMIEVTDRACKDGDTVNIDYSGSVDGVKFQGGTAEKQDLVLGSKSFIPGFEDQVVGMKIGETKDINVKFPEEYHAEDLKGKDAVFAIKLNAIKYKELPEVTDDFIKDATGTATVEDYKKETTDKLQKQNADRAERELENAIVKKISEGATVEIPDALIERQIDQMVQELEYRLMYQGMKMEDYLKYTNQKMEDFRNGYKEQATEIVKQQLVIGAIIDAEKIEATDEELDNHIKEIADRQKKTLASVKKQLDDKQKEYMKEEIIVKKLFDFLKTNNEITEVGK